MLVVALTLAVVAGCLPAGTVGTLAPTLSIADQGDVAIAIQNGMPVPDFGWQPRPRLDLDEGWLVERTDLDPELTMADRSDVLPAIEAEADGRQRADYDDAGWEPIEVPGTINPPPGGQEGGAWYRHHVEIPRSWADQAVTIRIGAANYVADVWLNGTWLGYHEGGSTPFAFEAGGSLRPGDENVLAIRVHALPIGTRSDVAPWGLVDWWNYGGLTGPVWLEAAPPVHVSRADVVAHLDAIDFRVVVHASSGPTDEPSASDGEERTRGRVRLTVFAATVDDANVLDPDPRALIADDRLPLAWASSGIDLPEAGAATVVSLSVLFGDADAWSPSRPALYVLRTRLVAGAGEAAGEGGQMVDELWTTFGIRHVAVDPQQPRVLLNGEPIFLRGVGIHSEKLTFSTAGTLLDGTPAQAPRDILDVLEDAGGVGANLVRAGHLPADPTMLMLADRLGFAVWEEIPMYHVTPLVFDRTMGRGVPQQMLREMALRDMNHPSVLFHGLANESTGGDERTAALAELAEVDRAIDGTRLLGQAAYGWRPDDPTQEPLDVAGFTMYQGVFYGEDPDLDTRRALRTAHEANPTKPIVILEFGRWADTPADEARQLAIFEETYAAIERFRADRPDGFVSAATWWTLHDFATQLPGIGVEDFGLIRPDGRTRPAGEAAADAFAAPAGNGAEQGIDPELARPRVAPPVAGGDWTLALYVAYALGISIAAIGAALFVLTQRGGRATGRMR
ncbi:MAG TPA: glycoside hydrolase family 2 TIM barrel-domain containing protein [Candidatus Limnocylindria bacterium]|nr:glycoside hydrolase family 2 TIM barrel-domain containing protein [Candidatus Limnocylindria bacterium]